MRQLRVIEFLSLDGVMQSPGSADEDTEGGFGRGGWLGQYFDDVLGESSGEGMATTDAYLFGRKTYEKMAAYWPNAPADDTYGRHLNNTPKYVASRTLDRVDWEGSQLLDGDVPAAVTQLKEQPGGDIAVLGSGELAQTLMEHDLVDEYELVVFPLLLGGGKRLFRETGDVRRLQLVDSKSTTTGGLILTYRPDR